MKDKSYPDLGLTMGWFGILLVSFIVLLITVAIVIAFTVGSSECAYNAKQYRKPTHYHKLYGCYIEVSKGQSIDINKYTGFKAVK